MVLTGRFWKEPIQHTTNFLSRTPTLEGLRNTLEVQSSWDPKAAKAKAEDFVDLRFVDQLRSSGFIDKLYGRY